MRHVSTTVTPTRAAPLVPEVTYTTVTTTAPIRGTVTSASQEAAAISAYATAAADAAN